MDSQKSSVSQADRELAAQWFFDPQCIEDHAIQIADHRTASVARREAEIVAWLEEYRGGDLNTADECDETGRLEAAATLRITAGIFKFVIDKIQTGGGA